MTMRHPEPSAALLAMHAEDEARGIDPRTPSLTVARGRPPVAKPVVLPAPDWNGEDA